MKEFRATVLTKLVKFWRDSKDIQLAIYATLSEFARRDELLGWIPGDQAVDTGALAEEIARLGKENASLREQLSKVAAQSVLFNGLTYEQLFGYLSEKKIDSTLISNPGTLDVLKQIAIAFGGSEPALLHLFWLFRDAFRTRDSITIVSSPACFDYVHRLAEFGLIKVLGGMSQGPDSELMDCVLTGEGRNFLMRLMLHPGLKEAPEYHFPTVDPHRKHYPAVETMTGRVQL